MDPPLLVDASEITKPGDPAEPPALEAVEPPALVFVLVLGAVPALVALQANPTNDNQARTLKVAQKPGVSRSIADRITGREGFETSSTLAPSIDPIAGILDGSDTHLVPKGNAIKFTGLPAQFAQV